MTAPAQEQHKPVNAIQPETVAEILGLLSAAIGLDPQTVGEETVLRGVLGQLRAGPAASLDEYLSRLKSSAAEMDKLIEEVVVPETWFFRDQEPFLYLKKSLAGRPAVASRPQVRVLSFPCSTGEEPYSIAIALMEAGLVPAEIQIDAVDVSQRALAAAAAACYGSGSFREDWPELREKYFHTQSKGWVLDERIARLVAFHAGNLLDPALLSGQAPYAFVFCRNAMIYLTPKAKTAVLRNLDRLLAPGGTLFVGHAEQVFFCRNGYQPVPHPRAFACIKKPALPLTSQPAPARRTHPAANRSHSPKKTRPQPAVARSTGLFDLPGVVEHDPVAARTGATLPVPPGPASGPPAESLAEIRALADRGDLEQAAARCESFLACHPLEPDALCLRGLIALARGRLVPAEESLLKAMYLDPEHYEAMVHLSLLYGQMGDPARAERFRQRAARCAGRK